MAGRHDSSSSAELQLRPRFSLSTPASPSRAPSEPLSPNPGVSSVPVSPQRRVSMGAAPSTSARSDEVAEASAAELAGRQLPSVITNDVFVMESDHSSQLGIFEGAPFWEDSEVNSEAPLPRPFYAPPKHKGLFSGHKGFAIVILLVLLIFLIGLILGLTLKSRCSDKRQLAIPLPYVSNYNPKLSQQMQNAVDPDVMKSEMKFFSKNVHQAGSRNNNQLANSIYNAWWNLQFDELFFDNYTVQLSLADSKQPNSVQVYSYQKSAAGELLVNATSGSEAVQGAFPYNAYSPSGTVEGEFVFVNYGTAKDLAALKVSLTGRLAVARIGGGYRAGVASRVAKKGAVGLLLYADPADFAFNASQVFPHGWLLPGDAPVFGNMRTSGGGGDPLTPDLPAVDGMYRTNNSRIHFSPIPVQSVGYDDCKKILDLLQGDPVPAAWSSSLGKRIGPTPNITLRIVSHNHLVQKRIQNVVAVLRGAQEPDRLVVLGNHYDAWLNGASDPLSGTVIVQQVSKLFAKEIGRAYRPRRTLVFAAWDAEEMGTIGSTEFTERLSVRLGAQAVAYINLDCPVKGDYSFFARVSPLLRGVVLKAASSVRLTPNDSRTVLDDWTAKLPANRTPGGGAGPEMPLLGGGSDQTSFLFVHGVPSAYPQYLYNGMLPNLPAYHTKYDTFAMMEILDADFEHHALVARVVIDLMLRLADSVLLPLSLGEYPLLMRKFSQKIAADKAKYEPLAKGDIDLNFLMKSIDNLDKAIQNFFKTLPPTNASASILPLRIANDAMMQVSRAFIWPEGLPSRSYYKNILLSPSLSNSYGGSFLSGFVDGLILGKRSGNWSSAFRHYSILVNAIHGTTLLLNKSFQ